MIGIYSQIQACNWLNKTLWMYKILQIQESDWLIQFIDKRLRLATQSVLTTPILSSPTLRRDTPYSVYCFPRFFQDGRFIQVGCEHDWITWLIYKVLLVVTWWQGYGALHLVWLIFLWGQRSWVAKIFLVHGRNFVNSKFFLVNTYY